MILFLVQEFVLFFFFKQKTAYEMRISDWSSDVCSSDLSHRSVQAADGAGRRQIARRGVGWIRRSQGRRCAHLCAEWRREAAQRRWPAPVQGRGDRRGRLRAHHTPARHRAARGDDQGQRSEEHTSELQSLMRISYAVFCLKKKT